MSLADEGSLCRSFFVSQECVELGLRSGALLFRDVRISAEHETLRLEIAQEIRTLSTRYPDKETIRASPDVIAFREILRKVGVNPRREQPSLERLREYAIKRGELPRINSLVDAYNLVSVRRGFSLGAHDVERIALPVHLRMLTGVESFTPLGHSSTEPATVGEFGYVDAQNRVLCRLDILQAEFSKVTTATRNVLLILEGTAWHLREDWEQACRDVRETVTRYCGGSSEIVATPF